ncbi:hypothetical protein [Paenibacillus faecalis]|uniref:hypothetical protein n=1 Tax=Paenibacillus faecalis TaxID=2079532 RepID=UPI000D0E37B3|nr:hypothetical protein [Paenibacillus faecalis]
MIPYIIVIALALIGGVATVMIGLSQENKKSNPKYERRTKKNIARLTLLYLLSLAAFIAIWVIYD